MKMNLTIVWLLLAVSGFAQQNEIDSLQQLLPSTKDTTRVIVLNKLAYRILFSDPKKAEAYANEAITIAKDVDFVRGLADGYKTLGISYDVRAQYDKSIDAHKSGLKVLDENRFPSEVLRLSLNNALGITYYHRGSYKEALETFLIALELSEAVNNINRKASILMNIGLVYHDQKQLELAYSYYKKSEQLAEQIGDRVLLGRVTNNLGTILKEDERYEEAIASFEISRKIKEESNDLLGLSATFANLASIHKRLRNYPIAIDYLDKAEALKLKIDDQYGLVIVNDLRAEIFIAQNRLAEAEKLIRENLIRSKPIGGENRVFAYERYHDLYVAKKDYKNALEWFKRKTDFSDSLFNETKSKQIAELQTLYEVNKKEKEIANLEKENQQVNFEKSIMIVSIGALSMIAVIGFFFFRFRIRKKQQFHKVELALQQEHLENAKLRENELQREIDFKNRELASYTMNFVQKSELMEEIKRNLQEIRPDEKEVSKKLTGLNKLIESSYQVDREWEDFKLKFEHIHRDFFKNLKARCPELTNGDLKLCALLKLNMNMKEAARILGISPESVKTARHRLRKKFELQQDDNLVDFILNISTEDVMA
jgi:Tfp pilus assembly protein PilF/DNA-binding CsgD family transcriptional regulator